MPVFAFPTGTEAFAPPPPAPPLDPLQPAEGQIEPGNIDLGTRPRMRAQQGEGMRPLGIDGQQVLVPTVSDDGRTLTDQEAIAAYKQTGKHLGKFATPEVATAYARKLSDAQRRAEGQPGMTFAEPDDLLGTATVIANAVNKRIVRGEGTLAERMARMERESPGTFVDFGDIARVTVASERSTRLTDNHVSQSAAKEEALDRRIAEIEAATGQKLENPERGGYKVDAQRSIRREIQANGMQPIDDKGGIPERQYRIFAEKVQALAAEHPDKAELFDLGSIGAEARVLAKESEVTLQQVTSDPSISGLESFIGQFAGGMAGSRRDPLFVGSFIAGPTTAVGKTTLRYTANYAIKQGLFNAGLTAIEQPEVQEWRRQIEVEHGLENAIERIGFAGLFGAVVGVPLGFAASKAVSKAARQSVQNIIDGDPKPGDMTRIIKAVDAEVTPEQLRAIKVGEENIKADRVAAAGLRVPDDELNGAALTYADDPINSPPPEAIMVERAILGEPTQQPAARQTVPGAAAPAEGMTRLYRAGPAPGQKAAPVADWLQDSPAHQNMMQASGRWFTDDLDEARWYIQKGEWSHLYYLDVPTEVAERSRVSNAPVLGEKAVGENPRAFSQRPEKEVFLPSEYQGKGQLMPEVAEPPPAAAVPGAGAPTANQIVFELHRIFRDQMDIEAASPQARAIYAGLTPKQKAAGFRAANLDEVTGIREPGGEIIDVLDDESEAIVKAAMEKENAKHAQAYADFVAHINSRARELGAPEAVDDELIKQVQEAQPQTQHEARMAIADVLETRGNREKLVALRNMLEADPLAPQGVPTAPPLIDQLPARLPTVETTRARLEAERAAAAVPGEAAPGAAAVPERPTKAEVREVGRYVNDSGAGDPNVIAPLVNRSSLGAETVVYRGHSHDDPLNPSGITSTSLNEAELSGDYPKVTRIIVDRDAPALRVSDLDIDNINVNEDEVILGRGKLIPTNEPGVFRFVRDDAPVSAGPAPGAAVAPGAAQVAAAAETPEIVPNWKGNDPTYVAKHVTSGNTIREGGHFGPGLHPKLLAEENGVQFYSDGENIYAVTSSGQSGRDFVLGPVVGTVKTVTKDGEQVLNHVVVSPDRRRQGLATRMLDLAQEHIPNLNANKTTELVSAEGAALLNARARAAAEGAAPARVAEAPVEPAAPVSRDPLDMIPMEGRDGSITLVTRDVNASVADRERYFAEVVRSCK